MSAVSLQPKMALLAVVLISLSSGFACADTITLTGTCSQSIVNATNNHITFNLSNSGNGTATNILLLPRVSGGITANTSMHANILAPDSAIGFDIYMHNLSYPGSYAQNFLVEYGQGSSAFIALFPCIVPIISNAQGAVVVGSVSNPSGSLYNATIENPSFPVNAVVQVAVPPELSAKPQSFNLTLGQSSVSQISYNVTPIVSEVGTFTSAIEVSYIYEGMHYASMRAFGVSIGSHAAAGTGNFTLIAIGAVIICIIILLILSVIRGGGKAKAGKAGD